MKYLSLGGALLATALATSGWCAEPQKAGGDKAINGVWVPVSAVMGGKSMTTEECKKINAVFLELNRVRRGIGYALDDFDSADAHFKSARSAGLGSNHATDDDTGFLRQAFQRSENFGLFFE